MRVTRVFPFLLAALVVGACEDEGVTLDDDYDLTFTGDATFNAAHGGQAIEVAVLDDAGTVIATESGTVSATADPAFSFEFDDVLAIGQNYDIHYWIDSNFNGGAAGTCDPPANDHQWDVDVGTVTGNVTITEDHAPADVVSVCDTFN